MQGRRVFSPSSVGGYVKNYDKRSKSYNLEKGISNFFFLNCPFIEEEYESPASHNSDYVATCDTGLAIVLVMGSK